LEFFEKEVRPILAKRCYSCHSATAKKIQGGLRLDSRAAALAGGDTGPAVVPKDLKESLLIDAIHWGDLYQMPPKTKLPEEEIATLTRWVELGAPWPEEQVAGARDANAFDLAGRKASHWCWQPIVDQPPPSVEHGAWVKSPIDQYILARLEAAGLTPNASAEKRTLIRRAYFDLIGLPPTPEQVAAFVQDESPQAFAKVVDELLASKHFGERWGRHWLDLVRYAESRGHEFDFDIPNAWQYRDYVIRALNADVPYDQFVTEHIAGDLLEQPRLNPDEGFNESVLGTGFWFLGEWVHSPVDIRKDECDRFDNMVDVFSKTFLAMTVSCARCHDHKFDAISQNDYYALFGYLQSSDYRQARFDAEHLNRPLAKQLTATDEAARREALALYRERLEPAFKELPNYLLAAHHVRSTDGAAVTPEAIRKAASESGLDADLLTAWLEYLDNARNQPDDLFRPLAMLLLSPGAPTAAQIAEQLGEVRRLATNQDNERRDSAAKAQIIIDYSRPQPGAWMTDGFAFGNGPSRTADLVLRTDGQLPLVVEVTKRGAAQRDLRWKGLSRVAGTQGESGNLARWEDVGQKLRTPTFEVTDDRIYYLVQGAGRAFAAVDSHRMLAGPLHGQTLKEWDTAVGAQWIAHDLSAYRGHRVHLEFSPRGDEELRVLMVTTGGPINPAQFSSAHAIASAVSEEASPNLQELCGLYADACQSALAEELSDPESAAQWRQWVVEHAELLISPPQREVLAKSLQALATKYKAQSTELAAQIKFSSRTAPAMWDGAGEDERLLVRGNHTTPRDIVPRHFLTAIAGEHPPHYAQGSGRLDLARLVLAENNPLTARVMANRVWQHLLGRAIAPSPDNFGVLGQAPTHPELLDHLAVQFRREGWSVKRLIRAIMLSNTYQMSSAPSDADRELDPQNLLWHRAEIKRLEAEAIRDEMLALSGRLNDRLYGPSVPVFLTRYMQGRGRPGSGPLDGDGRRSIYISIRRNFLSPMMLAFDAPSPFSTMGKRNVSNVPAQALTLMNDPFAVEQAKLWSQRVLANGSLPSPTDRIRRLYLEGFAREPSAEELLAAHEFLAQQATEYKLPPEAAARDERVWTDLCHVLMNVKEFIFIP
jgi:hypothetical protein